MGVSIFQKDKIIKLDGYAPCIHDTIFNQHFMVYLRNFNNWNAVIYRKSISSPGNLALLEASISNAPPAVLQGKLSHHALMQKHGKANDSTKVIFGNSNFEFYSNLVTFMFLLTHSSSPPWKYGRRKCINGGLAQLPAICSMTNQTSSNYILPSKQNRASKQCEHFSLKCKIYRRLG